jgi:hypothetical protein
MFACAKANENAAERDFRAALNSEHLLTAIPVRQQILE